MRLRRGEPIHGQPLPYVNVWCDGSSEKSPIIETPNGPIREGNHKPWVVGSWRVHVVKGDDGEPDIRLSPAGGMAGPRGALTLQRGSKSTDRIVLGDEALDLTDPRAYDVSARVTEKLRCPLCGLNLPVRRDQLTGALMTLVVSGVSSVKLSDLAAMVSSNRFVRRKPDE